MVPVIYAVSDAAGDTGEAVVRAATVQFYPQPVEIRRVPFLQDKQGIERLVDKVAAGGGLIVFTLVVSELREYLLELCERRRIPAVDLLGPIVSALEHALNRSALREPGMNHKLDADYFKKMEAVEFAVKYDDGRDFNGILQADIVLIGVSRTSKTPLSMYLAHKMYKVANVPLVPEISLPEQLFTVPSRKIVGLRIDPAKLNRIRSERLKALGLPGSAMYANAERIARELEYADSVMKRIGCIVIDVSDKAVEETASLIIEAYGK